MACRIAIVQYGNLRDDLKTIRSGIVEPYFGMTYSLDVLEDLVEGKPHLIISLTPPEYRVPHGPEGELVGLARPKLPPKVPGRIGMWLWARRIRREVARFRPTHVLIRDGGYLAEQLLKDCIRHNYRTLVIMANLLVDDSPRARAANDRLIAALNHPVVSRVGNHRDPATRSLIDHGLEPAKAMAWDWPDQKQPEDFPTKSLGGPPHRIVYVGVTSRAKGTGDAIDAAIELHRAGVPVELEVIGTGDELPGFREKARAVPEHVIRFRGRLPNDQVFEAMRGAALVVVPSRHEFPEGMPLTLTEALASRTPIVASDHPIIVRGFRDGDGLRFFRASDPSDLARVARSILEDPAEYARLSEATREGYRRVECPVIFGDLLDEWKRTMPAN